MCVYGVVELVGKCREISSLGVFCLFAKRSFEVAMQMLVIEMVQWTRWLLYVSVLCFVSTAKRATCPWSPATRVLHTKAHSSWSEGYRSRLGIKLRAFIFSRYKSSGSGCMVGNIRWFRLIELMRLNKFVIERCPHISNALRKYDQINEIAMCAWCSPCTMLVPAAMAIFTRIDVHGTTNIAHVLDFWLRFWITSPSLHLCLSAGQCVAGGQETRRGSLLLYRCLGAVPFPNIFHFGENSF